LLQVKYQRRVLRQAETLISDPVDRHHSGIHELPDAQRDEFNGTDEMKLSRVLEQILQQALCQGSGGYVVVSGVPS
jgi:hypothetical protein